MTEFTRKGFSVSHNQIQTNRETKMTTFIKHSAAEHCFRKKTSFYSNVPDALTSYDTISGPGWSPHSTKTRLDRIVCNVTIENSAHIMWTKWQLKDNMNVTLNLENKSILQLLMVFKYVILKKEDGV